MPSSDGQSHDFQVFCHLTAEKSALYRRILEAFVNAKASFVLHLRPGDVRSALGETSADSEEDFEPELAKLCEWGNLEANRDHADVTTAEDFYRPRFLYQLTSAGEAAEESLRVFHEMLVQPGELQTTTLKEIREQLTELAVLTSASELDEGRIILTLRNLTDRFEQLTHRAQIFLRALQRTIDLQGTTIERFLEYKQHLIDHLERFIGELVIATHEIAEDLRSIEDSGSDRLIEIAALRDAADALEHQRIQRLEECRRLWQARWSGFRGWFLGGPHSQSQAEMLRTRARSAIPALLGTVARINDRRLSRSDRVADLQTLARWFAQAPSEEDAHRLWRSAFSLAPARHLKVDAETLDLREQEPVSSQTSWLEAPPVEITPRIRQYGRHEAKGPARRVVDRSAEKELLARLVKEEAEQIAKAQKRLAQGRRMRLSELGALDQPEEFRLLLDLLGKALAAKRRDGDSVSASSSDGALQIHLEPANDGQFVTLVTSGGNFTGLDHHVTITQDST
ncbi:TIGR02677 family protein [Luteolibacter ambystomatis]|uniref:TIGR02677 family protein n=1 Tax=Luteolibacter ambystomatis TaxID=2824561 RepID=A0A975J1E7_9BACT|nr:TIGR02677 family protein [Luteolibacter ambystomatis]QUE52229.1 TIGR02677 family protein [Luteolibacter ambystomatis]